MTVKVGIVDYGMGNLHSVAKAVSLQGGDVVVSSQRAALKSADLLLLPGVGAFGAAMKNLAKLRLDDFVRQWIDEGKSYLGICLGFQLLFERSEESPSVRGLSVFEGSVVKFKGPVYKKRNLQIPHMGWNQIDLKNQSAADCMTGIPKGSRFYFVHSYYPVPLNPLLAGSTTDYGHSFCSSIATPNVFASQFHPEKSSDVGLRLLKNILKRAGARSLKAAA
jgi:glutamine amidotransferase